MSLDKLCRSIFIYFYEKVYKSPCPDSISSSKDGLESIDRFNAYIDKKYKRSLGPNYIYGYVLYQFGRYYDQIQKNEVKNPTGKITLKLVFGKRAIEVYELRRIEMDFMLNNSPLVLESGVSKSELTYKTGIKFEEARIQVKGYRDPTKAIASSGEDPLSTCEDINDLFDPNDPSCQQCSMKDECKQLLQTRYPAIYKQKNL